MHGRASQAWLDWPGRTSSPGGTRQAGYGWHVKARKVTAGLGRPVASCLGSSRKGEAGKARRVKARKASLRNAGKDRHVMARTCGQWQGRQVGSGLVAAWYATFGTAGEARQGQACTGRAGVARQGRHVGARHGRQVMTG